MLYLKKLIFDFVYCEFCLIFDKLISLKIQAQEGVGFFSQYCVKSYKKNNYMILLYENIIYHTCVQQCSLKYPVYHQIPNTKAVTTFMHELWRKQHLWHIWQLLNLSFSCWVDALISLTTSDQMYWNPSMLKISLVALIKKTKLWTHRFFKITFRSMFCSFIRGMVKMLNKDHMWTEGIAFMADSWFLFPSTRLIFPKQKRNHLNK